MYNYSVVNKFNLLKLFSESFILLFVTTLCVGWGLLTSIHTPLDMLLNFRLEMTPGNYF